MKYNTIIGLISKHLGDEIISEGEMLDYMDRTIDSINTQLNTSFPTFTEFKELNGNLDATQLDYNVFPDKYIRTVVVPGAAFEYYTTDEEGSYAAPKYEEAYRQGLFYMIRDYSFCIPEEYQEDEQGYIEMCDAQPGLTVPPRRGGMF